MAYAYVYAPCTGSNWGQTTYCYNGTTHTRVSSLGGWSPMDVSGGQGTGVYFWASSGVKSIRTTRVTGVCRSDPAPWTDGVKVDMYADYNGHSYMGTMGYGHLENRVSNGLYNSRILQVGALPRDCACGCSSGIHVHIQSTGAQRALNCYSAVYRGSTWLYRFNAF